MEKNNQIYGDKDGHLCEKAARHAHFPLMNKTINY